MLLVAATTVIDHIVAPLVGAGGLDLIYLLPVILTAARFGLRPGLFARVNLTLTTRENSILVPEQAMFAVGADQFVFKVVDGKVARVKVHTGERRAAKVEILDGLSPGDMIVTAGHLKIRDGVPVTVVPAVGS